MNTREIRTATRLIGRRTTLRYLAVGVGATLLAACTGKDKPAAPPSPSGPPSPSPSLSPTPAAPTSPTSPTSSASAASGVVGRAFAEFVKGTWAIRSTLPGGQGGRKSEGKAVVGADGTWSIVWSGPAGTWNGRWSHQGGRLDIQVLTGPKGDGEGTDVSFAQRVPDTVDDRVALSLPWYPLGANDMFGKLEAAYNGSELRIRHMDLSGSMSIHVCTRT